MKKLSLLLIAIFFSLVSVGNAMAEEPNTSVLDRNAVWTNKANPIGGMTDSSSGSSSQVSAKNVNSGSMNGETANFDFIRETKTYDHAKDKGRSA